MAAKKSIKRFLYYKVKSITKKTIERNGKKYLLIECASPIRSYRNAMAFIQKTGEWIIVDGVKYKFAGLGYSYIPIEVGETVQLALELKGVKKNVVDKKYKSKSIRKIR